MCITHHSNRTCHSRIFSELILALSVLDMQSFDPYIGLRVSLKVLTLFTVKLGALGRLVYHIWL